MASVGTYLDVVRLLEFKTHNSQQVVRVVLRDKPNESTWIFLSQIDKAKLPELVAALAANENAPSPTASQSIPSTPPATPQADQSANDTTAVIKPEPISFEAPPTPVSPDVKPPTLPQSPDIKPSVEPQISTNDTSTPLASRRRARIQPIKSEPFGTPPSLLALNHVHFFGDDDCMVVDPPPRPPPDIIEIVDDEPEIPTFSQTPLKVKTEISASVDGAEVAASPCECQPLAEVKNEPNTTKATNTTNATNTMDTTNTTNTTNTTSTTNTNSANTDGPINPTRLWSNTPISTNLPMDQSPASRIFRVPVPTPTQPIERSSESQSPSSVQSSHQSETTSAREGSAYDSNSSDDYYTPVSKRKDRDEDTSEPSAAKRPKENTNADMIAERKKRDPTKRYQMSKKEAFKYLYRAGKDDPAAVKEEDEDPTTRAFFMTLRERPVVHCTKRPSGPGAENTYIIKKRYSSKYGTSCHWCRQKTVDKKAKCANTKCQRQFCGVCMFNRHQLDIFDVIRDPTWLCPSCLDQCNCSYCFTRKHGQPEATGEVASNVHGLDMTTNQYVLKYKNNGMLQFGREEEISEMVRSIPDWRDIMEYYYPATGLPKEGPRVTCATIDDVKPTVE